MGSPFTIQIFYPDGDPESMRIVTQRNWTGTVLYISRRFWTEIPSKHREELKNPGIYILTGNSEDFENSDDDIQSIYIGQAENLFTRIEQHRQDQEKSFWESVICVTAGGDFNNAHFRWMESYLIEKSKEIDRCILKNGNSPNRLQIAEPERVDIEKFLDFAIQTFPIVEIDALTKAKAVNLPISTGEKEIQQRQSTDSRQGRIHREKLDEIKSKILVAIQRRENVNLLKRSRATFYDEAKKVRVCCSLSKNHNNNNYWFAFHERWKNFLQDGDKGYFIWGMEEQPKAICMTIEELNKYLDNFKKDESRNLWHIFIIEENGQFQFSLRGKTHNIDLSNYILELD